MKQSARTLPRRLSALVLALSLLLGLLPALGLPSPVETARAVSTGEAAMDQLQSWGVVGGYPDGSLGAERALTRAEFAAMINRAYGYSEPGETPFQDVPESAWYANDIAVGYRSGYFTGVSPRRAQPDTTLTREQALVMIGRNMRLEPVGGEVTEFADGRDFSSWSAAYARSAAQDGLINGYGDGTYRPKNDITRGEMALMLQRALGTLINNPGTHTLNDVYGNVTVSSPGATLRDSTVAGNLYITGGLGLGDITLENVRVLGDIVVAGGGESQSGESITLRNVEADSLTVDSMAGQYVSLAAEGNTLIPNTVLKTDTYIQDRTRPGEGLQYISLESVDPMASFSFSGNLETISNKTPLAAVNIAMGTVANYIADEEGIGSTLNLDINSTVKRLDLDIATPVTGVGAIDKLYVNTAGSEVEMLPDDISIRPGVTANVAGEDMNAAQAIESSSDPRLLAGYPKLKNVASTTATAVFEANKAGTVYWAVSATVDGSISEEELISPTSGNKRIVLSGNTKITDANQEFTASITKLTPDTGYYLSSVMVDARGRYSPVKVVSFHTPDNTVPNFASGYPKELQNDHRYIYETDENGNEIVDAYGNKTVTRDKDGHPVSTYYVQIASMANKTCELYYALYDTGSTAPTAAQFRSGALGQPIRSGVQDAIKNQINFVDFEGLKELTTYDAYFCLIDADGALSSAVKKVTFTTKDGTPPVFLYDTPVVTDKTANSIRLSASVNENATIYWAATTDEEYIKDSSQWNDEEWWRAACRQIESGTNAIRGGSASARAGTDTSVNITGLQPATGYIIYYVAKDAAGNYSEFKKDNLSPFRFYLTGNTLDNAAPTVRQEFTHLDETDPTMPYADTDVKLIFDEPVMQYSANRGIPSEQFTSFYNLYQAVRAAGSDAAALAAAKEALGNALRGTVTLYNTASINLTGVPDRRQSGTEDSWVIDYREVVVDIDPQTRYMTLTFPSADNAADGNGAIRLSSGATYYFVLDDIADISDSANRMPRTQLDNFTTISAQTSLHEINVTTAKVGAQTIPIDMAFSMTPKTTNVDSSVDWDIIFWSDTSVRFEVYELDTGNNGTTAHPVRNTTVNAAGQAVETGDAAWKDIIIESTYEKPNPDITADDYQGYMGQSLFRGFYNLSFNPSVTGKGANRIGDGTGESGRLLESGIMTPGESKYYGIHFKKIGDAEEKDRTRPVGDPSRSWEATINYRISVLTGSSVKLENLSRNIDKYTLQEAESRGVMQIHSPRPFSLQKVFADDTAPGFADRFPTIEYTDTEATLDVLLDRPGTLYYAVIPVREEAVGGDMVYTPRITTQLPGYATINNAALRTIRDLTGEDKTPTYATLPSPEQIYTLNFNDSTIKSGKLEIGSPPTSQQISLNDLMADTLYFVYFVTKGRGPVYSEQVMLYRFKTQEVNRPKLLLNRHSTSSVDMQCMNMNADAEFVLVMMSDLPDYLNQRFKDIADDARIAGDPDRTAHEAATYTVLDALKELDPAYGGSVFDEYAKVSEKDLLRKIITGQEPINSVLTPSLKQDLVRYETAAVDCEALYSGRLQDNENYLFLAQAKSKVANASTSVDSYGFAAYEPVMIYNDDPPRIQSIIGNLTIDYNPKAPAYVIQGTITVTFDKALYLFVSQNVRTRLTSSNLAQFQEIVEYSDGTSGPIDSKTIQPASIKDSPSGDMITMNVSYQTTDDHGTVSWVYAMEGNFFTANGNLASYRSTPSDHLQLTLNYHPERGTSGNGEVGVTVSNPALWVDQEQSWAEEGVAYIPVVEVKKSGLNVESIFLSPSSKTIQVGESFDVTATVEPATATNRRVVWEMSDTKIATTSDTDNTYDADGTTVSGGTTKVTGQSPGTTVLTCYSVADHSVIAACEIEVMPIKIDNIIVETQSGTQIASLKDGQRQDVTDVPTILHITCTPASATIFQDTSTDVSARIEVSTSRPDICDVEVQRLLAPNEFQLMITLPRSGVKKAGQSLITIFPRDGTDALVFTVTVPETTTP